MRFGKNLKTSTYEPWKGHYIDYTKLKSLLRENDAKDGDGRAWTDEDEGRFVEELVNVQLEKVNAFQVEQYKELRERTANCESELEEVAGQGKKDENGTGSEDAEKGDQNHKMSGVEKELDSISKEVNELEKFSRLNYTGFLKAAKKHDRRRGSNYKVRPLLQVRLAALPFNSEDYSPLLYRLSAMYSYVRQRMHGRTERSLSVPESNGAGEKYTSLKFFVHPENLLEVKTYILRRLPVLVYNPMTAKIVEAGQRDPTITSVYFDNPKFSLYTRKVERAAPASSLRLRWSDQLTDKPDILVEKKTISENEESEEIRFPIKDKYVMPFIKGEYRMEKSIQKLRGRKGGESEEVHELEKNSEEIQKFILEHDLQPVLRANYTRTAFQIPGDDRVRVSIDTNLALIREDSLDTDRPCRDPESWHRLDIDGTGMDSPFTDIKKGEISRFPYAVLEIKVKNGAKKKASEWLLDLMSSHLVKEAPRFSKFVHGVAQLFEDYINTFPFWLSFLETDIRRDPDVAFQEEQDKKAKQAADENAVGSFMGSKSPSNFKPATASPSGKTSSSIAPGSRNGKARHSPSSNKVPSPEEQTAEEEDSDDDGLQGDSRQMGTAGGLRSLLPSFSASRYARAHRQDNVQLPPGVHAPKQWIKDSGPVLVEPKVWLANQRTFIKWMHVSVLLATLSLSLYNGAGESNPVGRILGVVYTIIALGAGAWGWWIYIARSRMIEQRSGKDFDSIAGPIAVCTTLVVALCLNFGFKYRASLANLERRMEHNYTDNFLLTALRTSQQSFGIDSIDH
ncbi:Phosphate metabolism transcription protein [Trapelia coarctata]|nr:Phosphate metabolism transcription protein [Trapelia coarctata]